MTAAVAPLDAIRRNILAAVRVGMVFATSRTRRGPHGDHVVFVAVEYATREDKEFTRRWLEEPHFVAGDELKED